MSKRWFWASTLLTGCGAALSYVFIHMQIVGSTTVVEPIWWVRWGEILMSLFILGYGLSCWISLFKKRRKNGT